MKSILKTITLILIVFAFHNCSKYDCDNIVLDDKTLDNVSKEYECYKGINSIFFLDENGNEYEYTSQFFTEQQDRPFLFSIECDDKIKEARYNGDYILRTFVGPDSTRISFVLSTTFIDGEEEFFERNVVDLLRISIFDSTDNFDKIIEQFQFITSNKDGVVDKSTFNDAKVNFIGDIELHGKNFNSVYEQIDFNSNPILFNKTDGVVSFENKNQIPLLFDRFE